MKRALLDRLLTDRAAKRPAALVTDLGDGRQAIVREGDAEGELAVDETTLADVREALRRDDSDVLEAGGRRFFVQVHNPPPRLFLVGAVHIAQALAPMAALAGYGVSVIDPRRSFATEARFPGLALSHAWPDEAMATLGLDSRTAVVTLTHDPKLDDPALVSALRSTAFYIGALGSKRTHAARLSRLAEVGFSHADLARIHGPVGLSIGALSPAEIAVSILAQVTAVRRNP
jgi:xanthine dehydrogenase accessory factor